MTVEELGSRMTSTEFRQWQEFAELEPFGGMHEDWRLGYLIANVLNPLRGKGKPPFTALDFAPSTVHKWVELLRETKAKANGGVPEMPKHPTVSIFEELLRDNLTNVDDRPT